MSRINLSNLLKHFTLEQLSSAEKLALVLSRPAIPQQKGENALSVQVADFLRGESIAGRLIATWSHVANEGKRSECAGAVCKAMGMVPGAPDYVFVWPNGGGWIEIKTAAPQSKLSNYQQLFQWWNRYIGNRNAVCRSVDEVSATLKMWGCLA